MKQLVVAFALALSTTGCVEIDAAPPADDTAVDTEAAFRATCGEGQINYYAWVCHWGFGWTLDRVGYQGTNCEGPYLDALVGRRTTCSDSTESYCSPHNGPDGSPQQECNSPLTCSVPRPTTYCYTMPVLTH